MASSQQLPSAPPFALSIPHQSDVVMASSQQPPPPPPPDKFKQLKERWNYVLGWVLIGCALVDGAIDPFAGLTAQALLGSGMALIGVDKISEIFK